jgi:hypothetical protein
LKKTKRARVRRKEAVPVKKAPSFPLDESYVGKIALAIPLDRPKWQTRGSGDIIGKFLSWTSEKWNDREPDLDPE